MIVAQTILNRTLNQKRRCRTFRHRSSRQILN
ncbi:Bgt-50391 [Blumeria graminis f. sp. tritici]|uniref:Bgt-50391 n=1 Tax=Blumeria graminis f. sp. tritici TaxID=62690 RepID=A0A9X9LA37_BLUGR|nr:Bgt-50391 [Blumeria graminis f. sp. tritici]